jgi:hypothetical protein
LSDQASGEALPDAPVARLVGVRQGRSGYRFAETHVVELGRALISTPIESEMAREIASRDRVSMNQFIASAFAEKIAAMTTETYLRERAGRASEEKFRAALWRGAASYWHGNRFGVGDLSLESTMPTLPSGRRVEFSLDRFHALLGGMDPHLARLIVKNLNDPDDLLPVTDAVHFSLKDGAPYFAGYVAADWATHTADWGTADRQALQAWFDSSAARQGRAEAIDYIRGLWLERPHLGMHYYPYLIVGELRQAGFVEGSSLRH